MSAPIVRDENPNSGAREWLVTNGLGGFASATVSGEITRRYHGFLIAALPAPLGRIVMLNDLDVRDRARRRQRAAEHARARADFAEFTLSMGSAELALWRSTA